MEKRVTVSAPGKIILAGEHAVVYGQPALVAAIDRRLQVTVKPGKSRKQYTGLLKFALNLLQVPTLKDRFPRRVGPYKIDIDSQLPIGSGMGSSAALATALVWALKPKATINEKNRLVKIFEDYQHGKSSGVDQTIVREGGFLRYQQGQFKTINLPIKQAILIDSGKPKESTGDMVKQVAKGRWEKEFQQIGRLVNNWRPEKIFENERLLEKIGVVGLKAKKIIRQIESIGGMAKICGAGGVKAGSGRLLVWHRDLRVLFRLIKRQRWQYMRVNLGGPGVRYER
jgi:mevalonate kinase